MNKIYNIIIGILIASILVVAGFILFWKPGTNTPPIVEVEEEEVYNVILFGDNNITVESKDEYKEPGYYAILNNEIVTDDVVVTNNLKDEPGEYTIVYKYRDKEEIRTVTIIDKVIESNDGEVKLELIGDSEIIVNKGEEYKELKAKAYYNSENISDLITISGTVDTKTVGQYKIIYHVEYSGQIKEIERIVKVINIENLNLDFSYDSNYTNKNILLGLTVSGTNYLYMRLPNNVVTSNRQEIYEINSNGKYKFVLYDKNNNSIEKEINIKNIDKEAPKGSCKLVNSNGKTVVTVSASDNIGVSKYLYNSKYTSTSNSYTFNETLSSVSVKIYDKAGNTKDISCSTGTVTPPVEESGNIEMHFMVTTSDDDAILIRTNKETIMIDGGQYDKNHKVISYLKDLGIKKIDLLIGSHVHWNHIQEHGPIIENFQVSKAIYSLDIKNCKKNGSCDSKDIKYVLDAINKYNIPVEMKAPGDYIELGEIKMYFLAPLKANQKHNKNSFVFILKYRNTSYMFTGDTESKDMDASKLQSNANKWNINLDVDLLKWPHHGYNQLNEAIFAATTPKYIYIPSSGCSTKYPSSSDKKLIKKYGSTVYSRCDKNVVLISDGKNIEIKTNQSASDYKR